MKPLGNPSLVHKLEDVAVLLGVGRTTVTRLIDSGELHAVDMRAGGNRPRLRIADTELARFIASREMRSPTTSKLRSTA